MPEFNTSLLREKFVIRDIMPEQEADREPVIALSNRMPLPLTWKDGETQETFVIRAHNMHSCVRMGAFIAKDFQDYGPILARSKPFDWKYAYLTVTKGYEKKWNPNRWIAVYNKGRLIFADGAVKHHPFLDIIEQCDARNKGDYEKAVSVAQEAFSQAGKAVDITHNSNVALVVNIKNKDEGKCGLILRAPNKTTTFNMTIRSKRGRPVRISSTLSACSSFLEGVQLAFLVGMTEQKKRYELIGSGSEDALKGEDASRKLGRLNGAVDQFENLYDVSYRPERPNFAELVIEAEDFAKEILGAEIKRKIETGEDESGDWVV